jgi:hypothetical protein
LRIRLTSLASEHAVLGVLAQGEGWPLVIASEADARCQIKLGSPGMSRPRKRRVHPHPPCERETRFTAKRPPAEISAGGESSQRWPQRGARPKRNRL